MQTHSFVIGLPTLSVAAPIRPSVCPLNCIFCIAVQVTRVPTEENAGLCSGAAAIMIAVAAAPRRPQAKAVRSDTAGCAAGWRPRPHMKESLGGMAMAVAVADLQEERPFVRSFQLSLSVFSNRPSNLLQLPVQWRLS